MYMIDSHLSDILKAVRIAQVEWEGEQKSLQLDGIKNTCPSVH